MISKQTILKNQVFNFFENDVNMSILFQCLKSSNPVSLRLIDWFVTTYCKLNSNKIACDLGIDIYNSYKGQLKSYNKIFFDPFCRNNNKKNFIIKMEYITRDNEKIQFTTSLGQLNFFRWVINLNIINYIETNLVYLKQQSKIKNRTKTKIMLNQEVSESKVKEKIYLYSVSF